MNSSLTKQIPENGENGYFIIDGLMITRLGVGDQYTFFEIDEVYGDWTLDGKEYYLNIKDLLPILNDENGFHRVKLDDIAWKGFDLDMSFRADNCFCWNGNRFRDCNPTIPGILLEGTSNPGGRKYRCLDGKHRIEALLSYEQTHGIFYILNMDHINEYLIKYDK